MVGLLAQTAHALKLVAEHSNVLEHALGLHPPPPPAPSKPNGAVTP
jgi:hypothetical protein